MVVAGIRVVEQEGMAMRRSLLGTILMIITVVFLPALLIAALLGGGTDMWVWAGVSVLVFLVGLYLRKHPDGR